MRLKRYRWPNRWHLLNNLVETLGRSLERHRPTIVEVAKRVNHKCAAPPSFTEEPATQAVQRARQNRERRLARYQEFRNLVETGMNYSEASRRLEIPLRTVQRWVACGVFPERKHRVYPSIVDAYGSHLKKRYGEGCRKSCNSGKSSRNEASREKFRPFEAGCGSASGQPRRHAATRRTLEKFVHSSSTPQSLAMRSRIVLAASDGSNNQQIAAALRVPAVMVGKWRRSFAIDGLEGLRDSPRSGRPRRHDSDIQHKVQTRVCQQPEDQGRWTVRTLAAEVGLPASTVHAMLVAAKLQPHRIRTFTFSPDPDFEAKLLDIVGLYLNPPENALVLCVDEKTGIQALNRTQPGLPLRTKKPRAWTNEYVWHGTQTLLAALEIATGKVIAHVRDRRTTVDFLSFMDDVVKAYPVNELCVVLDNLNIHKNEAAKQWLLSHPRVHFHYTPTHASWMNMVECFFSVLTRQGLKQSVHRSKKELKDFLIRYLRKYSENPTPFTWTKGPEHLQRIIEATKEYQIARPSKAKQRNAPSDNKND